MFRRNVPEQGEAETILTEKLRRPRESHTKMAETPFVPSVVGRLESGGNSLGQPAKDSWLWWVTCTLHSQYWTHLHFGH